jgi:NlpC/P60 family putative phage cell wall peptidase
MTVTNAVVAEARRWLGTPFRHQGRRRGVGCDCLGLVLGIWEAVYGQSLPAPADYPLDWAGWDGGDPLAEAVRLRFGERVERLPAQGDLLLFRWGDRGPARHCAIVVEPSRMIHAVEGRGVLCSPLGRHWRAAIAGVFSFPPL